MVALVQLLDGKLTFEGVGVDDCRLTIRFRSHSQIAISFAEGPAEYKIKYRTSKIELQ